MTECMNTIIAIIAAMTAKHVMTAMPAMIAKHAIPAIPAIRVRHEYLNLRLLPCERGYEGKSLRRRLGSEILQRFSSFQRSGASHAPAFHYR